MRKFICLWIELGQPDLILVFLGQAESMNSDWSNLRNITWEGLERFREAKFNVFGRPAPAPTSNILKLACQLVKKSGTNCDWSQTKGEPS